MKVLVIVFLFFGKYLFKYFLFIIYIFIIGIDYMCVYFLIMGYKINFKFINYIQILVNLREIEVQMIEIDIKIKIEIEMSKLEELKKWKNQEIVIFRSFSYS